MKKPFSVTSISLLVMFVLISSNPSLAQERVPDKNLGAGIVHLCMGEDEKAIGYFMMSRSANAMAILERIVYPEGPFTYEFDYTDPTLWGFYAYLVCPRKKPQYSFLDEVARELDKRKPNRELGELEPFKNAYFSPKATYLTIYSFNKTILLETGTGKLIELIEHGSLGNAQIIFSQDEDFLLRYIGGVVTYEDFKNKKVIWKKGMKDMVLVSFSKDYSKVIIFNYKAGKEGYNIYVYEIDVRTGKQISKKVLKNIEWESIRKLFAEYTAVQIDYDPVYPGTLDPVIDMRIESPDKRYVLEGDKSYGNFILMDAEGKTIREFWFASGIE